MIHTQEDYEKLKERNFDFKSIIILLLMCILLSLGLSAYLLLDETQQHKLIHNEYWDLHSNYRHSEMIITISNETNLNSSDYFWIDIEVYRYIGEE